MLRPGGALSGKISAEPMKILVTFAVDAEFAPWRKLRRFSETSRDAVPTYAAQVGATELRVLLTGVGGRKAWAEATKLIWDSDVDICISSGLAGALRPEHHVGDVLAAREVQAANWNKVIPCNATLLRVASTSGAKLVGAFHSANRVLVRAEEKDELSARADAVEMESGDILLEAVAFGAKVIAVRGISDAAGEDLPLDFNRTMTPAGDVSIARVLRQAAAHPSSLPALIRFGWHSHRAAEKLAVFLDRYVQELAHSPVDRSHEEVSA